VSSPLYTLSFLKKRREFFKGREIELQREFQKIVYISNILEFSRGEN